MKLCEKGPLNTPKIKVLGVLLWLLWSDRSIWHHLQTLCEVHFTWFFSHFCLQFIPWHSSPWASAHKAPFPFKTHFFVSHCPLADRGASLHHIDRNLPTIVSGTFSSDKNFLVSWVELFTEIFIEKDLQISPIIFTIKQSGYSSSTYCRFSFWPR